MSGIDGERVAGLGVRNTDDAWAVSGGKESGRAQGRSWVGMKTEEGLMGRVRGRFIYRCFGSRGFYTALRGRFFKGSGGSFEGVSWPSFAEDVAVFGRVSAVVFCLMVWEEEMDFAHVHCDGATRSW